MKNLLILILSFFTLSVFSQPIDNVRLEHSRKKADKEKQYIGITYNGKGILSDFPLPANQRSVYDKKGHFKSFLLTDFVDSVFAYAQVSLGGFFVPSIATENVEQDADGNEFELNNFSNLDIRSVIGGASLHSDNTVISADTFLQITTNSGNIILNNNDSTYTFGHIPQIAQVDTVTHTLGYNELSGAWFSVPVKYKVYTALLTQTGTNAPVATVLENTLGGDIIWSYSNVGEYHGTLTGAFPQNHTVFEPPIQTSKTVARASSAFIAGRINDNTVLFQVDEGDQDGVALDCLYKIYVY